MVDAAPTAMPGSAQLPDLSRLQAGTVPSSGSSDVWNDPGSSPGLGPLPPPQPDPFAAFFSLIPASRLSAQAWAPPIFADSIAKFPQPPPQELPLEMGNGGILGGIGKMLADQKAAANDPWAAARNSIVGQFADPPLRADGLPANFGQGGILGALRDLQPSTSNAQAVRRFTGNPQPFPLPNAGGYQGLDPNSLVRLVADHSAGWPPGDRDLDKEPHEDDFKRKVDIPSQIGLNLPGVGSVLPLPLGQLGPPPSLPGSRGALQGPQAQPPRAAPAAPSPPPLRGSSAVPAANNAPQSNVPTPTAASSPPTGYAGNPAAVGSMARGTPTASSSGQKPLLEWQQFERNNGSQQTTRRTTYQGEDVTVRLDYPPDQDGILDLKKYNWWKPGYQVPFLQGKVKEDFQNQIQKYQTLHPTIRFRFSEEPPDWAKQAIYEVGGTYFVEP